MGLCSLQLRGESIEEGMHATELSAEEEGVSPCAGHQLIPWHEAMAPGANDTHSMAMDDDEGIDL